jgi:hypothetical protein
LILRASSENFKMKRLLFNEAASIVSDVDRYVIIRQLLDSIFEILPAFKHTNILTLLLRDCLAYGWIEQR